MDKLQKFSLAWAIILLLCDVHRYNPHLARLYPGGEEGGEREKEEREVGGGGASKALQCTRIIFCLCLSLDQLFNRKTIL